MTTLNEYMKRKEMSTRDLATLTGNTIDKINGCLRRAEPWRVTLISGKAYAHPAGRMFDLEPHKKNSGLRSRIAELEGALETIRTASDNGSNALLSSVVKSVLSDIEINSK